MKKHESTPDAVCAGHFYPMNSHPVPDKSRPCLVKSSTVFFHPQAYDTGECKGCGQQKEQHGRARI